MATGNLESGSPVLVSLEMRPERRLISPRGGSRRHLYFGVRVGDTPAGPAERPALRVSLVIDRSGSMTGDKIQTAKQAALAMLDRLTAADQASIVVFDDVIDVVAEMAPVTPVFRARAGAALQRIDARGNTALHEGWLQGCQSIASDAHASQQTSVARCFLLSDGQANRGIVDHGSIAAHAAGVRSNAGVSTSTFGIGSDYDERLLARMAVAGGGQFHDLQSLGAIGTTYMNELGEMLSTAAARVLLEIRVSAPGIVPEMISAYPLDVGSGYGCWSVAIGDLLPREERQIVLRLALPAAPGNPTDASDSATSVALQARVVWHAEGRSASTAWQQIAFHYARSAERADEAPDRITLHWVGLHHGYRAQQRATELNQGGDLDGARRLLEAAASHIHADEGDDVDLLSMRGELESMARRMSRERVSLQEAKASTYDATRRSRSQRDLRR